MSPEQIGSCVLYLQCIFLNGNSGRAQIFPCSPETALGKCSPRSVRVVRDSYRVDECTPFSVWPVIRSERPGHMSKRELAGVLPVRWGFINNNLALAEHDRPLIGNWQTWALLLIINLRRNPIFPLLITHISRELATQQLRPAHRTRPSQ